MSTNTAAFKNTIAQLNLCQEPNSFSPDLLFELCLYAKDLYHHVEEAGDYYAFTNDNTLYLLLQWSHGIEDWKNNFDFPAQPYRDMPVSWKAHRGFVRVWKAIEPYVKDEIMRTDISSIIVIGYSHGAALTALAHEYVWFNRPDLRPSSFSFAFEAPRVFCGASIPEEMKERWKNLYVFRTANDIVTHLPPAIFGFKHVGNFIHINVPKNCPTWKKYRCLDSINAHYPSNVLMCLHHFDNSIPKDNPNADWTKEEWTWEEESSSTSSKGE